MKPPPCRARIAFTLVELLVVIAIIALLISILLPSLTAAREQGRETVCLAHLANFGRGFHTYAVEQRDYLCSGSFDPDLPNHRDGPVDQVGWVADLVNSGTASPGAQLCPSNVARHNQKIGRGPSAGASPTGAHDEGYYSPVQAAQLVDGGYNTNYTQAWYMARCEWNPYNNADGGNPDLNLKRPRACLGPLRVSAMARVTPARVPLMGDGSVDHADEYYDGGRAVKTMTDGPFGGPFGLQSYSDFGPAHGSGIYVAEKGHNRVRANVLFGDAHVSFFQDTDHTGDYQLILDEQSQRYEQADLNQSEVFDGVLSLGRRSTNAWAME